MHQRGLTRHIWATQKKGINSNDTDFLCHSVRGEAARWGFIESILGDVGEGPIILFQSPNQGCSLPHILITAGFHGEEPAGSWGILEFLEQGSPDLFDKVSISLIPWVNLAGLSKGHRFNFAGENPNRGYFWEADTAPSKEGAVLLHHSERLKDAAKDGVLCCHEDSFSNSAYAYTFEEGNEPGTFSKSLRDELGRFFNISTASSIDNCSCTEGIIYNHFDTSFESWMVSSGSRVGACTETPALAPFHVRVNANHYVMGAFIAAILEHSAAELS
ncbi:M14 family metallocarboxypeptidase [Pantoea sp. GbtcB22]|uniref:M14 family metallopeptidase n=1 Tax=Pantoea sp. GbtcB22 TaxID=2824767 RepID=UPI0020C677CB|nr:M14 family metallocarboxypeptidase [Pantoea sp. GbtcB22]